MSRPDAERALNIYKTFGKQTYEVVQFLSLARQYEMSTRLEVPKLKHAPTTLTSSLEDYLNDPDFEVNRRQYLAQQQAKKSGKPMSSMATKSTPFEKEAKPDASFPATKPTINNPPTAQQHKGPAPDLIDFFESIEQNQQPMAQQNAPPQQYTTGYPQAQQYQQTAQQTGYNPFLPQGATYGQFQPQQQQQPQPLQPDFTGAGFGGYGPQPPQQQISQPNPYQSSLQSIPQNGVPNFQAPAQVQSNVQAPAQQLQPQQTSSNPFRQPATPTGSSISSSLPPTRQSTNPFARNANVQPPSQQQSTSAFAIDSVSSPVSASSPFTSAPPQSQQSEFQANSLFSPHPQSTTSPTSQLQPQRTGTNPFARNRSPPNTNSQFQPTAAASPLVTSPTGSTNPFRQSAFVNQQTGTGWQHSGQGTFGGFDVNNVETMPVFPRPGQN
jgi:phosphatidylinositol-binding clathrin assembly protein